MSMASQINQDRSGEQVDRSLLKNVVEYFLAARSVGGTCYHNFRMALLADAAAYYSQIASNGLLYDSCDDYMRKVVSKILTSEAIIFWIDYFAFAPVCHMLISYGTLFWCQILG